MKTCYKSLVINLWGNPSNFLCCFVKYDIPTVYRNTELFSGDYLQWTTKYLSSFQNIKINDRPFYTHIMQKCYKFKNYDNDKLWQIEINIYDIAVQHFPILQFTYRNFTTDNIYEQHVENSFKFSFVLNVLVTW